MMYDFLAGLYKNDCDVYPHLEAVTISKRIELEGWGLAQPLYLFKFFQNLPYLVHLYATGDSQSHLKLPNLEGVNTIESRPDQSDCVAYPHLEAVAVSKQIELGGWGLAQPLHVFEFF